MIGVMAAGQLGQAAQAQNLPPQTQLKPDQTQSLPAQTELGPALALTTPWTLQTSLSVTEQYNDNVFLSTGPNDPNTPERSDMVTILTPALTISRQTERLTVAAQYQPTFNLYAKYHDELNYIGQAGSITLEMKNMGPGVLQHTQLNLSDAVSYTESSLYNSPSTGQITGNGGIITPRSKSWNNSTTALLSQQLTEVLQGRASFAYVITRYKTSGLTDSDEQNLSLGLSDQWSQRSTVSATYSYTNFIYDVANTNRQVTQSITVGLEHAATPTLQTRVSLGASVLSSNNRYYPVGSASLTKRFQYTSVSISYNNNITTGGGISQAPTINETGSLSITRLFGPHARANVSGGYTDQRTTTTPTAVTNSFNIGASANYDVTQWLNASVSYNHSSQQGNNNAAGQDIRSNTVAVTLNGTWGTQIR